MAYKFADKKYSELTPKQQKKISRSEHRAAKEKAAAKAKEKEPAIANPVETNKQEFRSPVSEPTNGTSSTATASPAKAKAKAQAHTGAKQEDTSQRYFKKYSDLSPEQKAKSGSKSEHSEKRAELGLKGYSGTKQEYNEQKSGLTANYDVEKLSDFDLAGGGAGAQRGEKRLSAKDLRGLEATGNFSREELVNYAEDVSQSFEDNDKGFGNKAQNLLDKYKAELTPTQPTPAPTPEPEPTPQLTDEQRFASDAVNKFDSDKFYGSRTDIGSVYDQQAQEGLAGDGSEAARVAAMNKFYGSNNTDLGEFSKDQFGYWHTQHHSDKYDSKGKGGDYYKVSNAPQQPTPTPVPQPTPTPTPITTDNDINSKVVGDNNTTEISQDNSIKNVDNNPTPTLIPQPTPTPQPTLTPTPTPTPITTDNDINSKVVGDNNATNISQDNSIKNVNNNVEQGGKRPGNAQDFLNEKIVEIKTDENQKSEYADGYGDFLDLSPDSVTISNWIDMDGDGVDDRNQTGPGQPNTREYGSFTGSTEAPNENAQESFKYKPSIPSFPSNLLPNYQGDTFNPDDHRNKQPGNAYTGDKQPGNAQDFLDKKMPIRDLTNPTSFTQDNDINSEITGNNNYTNINQDNSIRNYGGDNRSFTYNSDGKNPYTDNPVSMATMMGFYSVDDSPAASASFVDQFQTLNRDAQKQNNNSIGRAEQMIRRANQIPGMDRNALEDSILQNAQAARDRSQVGLTNIFGDLDKFPGFKWQPSPPREPLPDFDPEEQFKAFT